MCNKEICFWQVMNQVTRFSLCEVNPVILCGDFPGVLEAPLHDAALDEDGDEPGEHHAGLEGVRPQHCLHPSLQEADR